MTGARVFVSYRRDDSRHLAGRLADHLSWERDVEHVFFDTSTVPPGAPFPKAIDDALARATHTLVVIGPNWDGGVSPRREQPRLFDEFDFVRREVSVALDGPGEVIPVLVDGAPMPVATDLPPSLQALHVRNAFVVPQHGRFEDNLLPLVAHIIGHEPKGADTWRSIAMKSLGGAVAGVMLFVAFSALLQYGLAMNAEHLFGAADPVAARERFAMLPWVFGAAGALTVPLAWPRRRLRRRHLA